MWEEEKSTRRQMNAPDRFELFVLPEGVKKVTVTADTRMPNTSTFAVEKEDHTLGNVLARQMQRQAHVRFAGYRVPHPLEHSFLLKVQTDATTTPLEAVQRGIDQLIFDLSLLEESVRHETARFAPAAAAAAAARRW